MSTLPVTVNTKNTNIINNTNKYDYQFNIEIHDCIDYNDYQFEYENDSMFKNNTDNNENIKNNNLKCSETFDIPNFPIGNTPPKSDNLKLVYLNLLATKYLNKI